ncbi:MAG: YigZ family protein [Ruminococcaceae bacterium]|nr:YigZ family protein [Oscillospiraceae bacterium]
MEYRTVAVEAQDEFIEKRSRFIGYIKPVTTEEEAIAFIEDIRTKHWNATHNVYAYCLREGGLCRYSDDGEPSGTAGQPVLSVLTKGGITDAVVVVTRYFGGVLLGAGGLVRAYSHGAALAVAAGKPIVMRQCRICAVQCDYSQYGRVSTLIPEVGGFIDDSAFAENVEITFHLTDEQLGVLGRKLADATCGQCEVTVLGEEFFACPDTAEE